MDEVLPPAVRGAVLAVLESLEHDLVDVRVEEPPALRNVDEDPRRLRLQNLRRIFEHHR